jgi:hypothetical protein
MAKKRRGALMSQAQMVEKNSVQKMKHKKIMVRNVIACPNPCCGLAFQPKYKLSTERLRILRIWATKTKWTSEEEAQEMTRPFTVDDALGLLLQVSEDTWSLLGFPPEVRADALIHSCPPVPAAQRGPPKPSRDHRPLAQHPSIQAEHRDAAKDRGMRLPGGVHRAVSRG